MNALIKRMMPPSSTNLGQHSDSWRERAGLITKNFLLLTSLMFGMRTVRSTLQLEKEKS